MSDAQPFDLIVAGVGGQGSLFASQVIAQAAFHQGLSVRVAETYGVAQRGGSVYSQIRIGHGVSGPLIPRRQCRAILGLEPIEALRRATDYLAPGGSVVLNTRVADPLETKMGRQPHLALETILEELGKLDPYEILEVDALALATEAGGAASSNVVMLGALVGLACVPLTYDAMREALKGVSKPNHLERNLLSLSRGREYAAARFPRASSG